MSGFQFIQDSEGIPAAAGPGLNFGQAAIQGLDYLAAHLLVATDGPGEALKGLSLLNR